MATFLRKFADISEYNAATLTQPCVSLISNMNDVKFDHIPAKAILTYDNGLKYVKHCDAWPDLTKIDITPSGYDYTKVTDAVVGECVNELTNTFQQFYSLTSVTIPNSVSAVGDTFANCISLTELELPSSITQMKKYQFIMNCSALTAVTIWAETPPSCNYPALLGADNANVYVPIGSLSAYKTATNWSQYASRIFPIPSTFDGKWFAIYSDSSTQSAVCDSTSAITNGEINLTNLTDVFVGQCVTSIDDTAFYNCTSLTSVTIPNSVTSIGKLAFNGCTSLSSITIPNSVTIIDYCAFTNSTSLSSLTIGSGVTTIGEGAFHGTRLTSVTIPSGVTSIDNNAFGNCPSLQSVTCLATTPPTLGTSVFNSANNYPIYVPSESVSAYQSANNWSTYASRIEAIPNS